MNICQYNIMSKISIYEPLCSNPYTINTSEPITLRTACTAGVNRSATVREYIKSKISQDSFIFPQYGAFYGDYDNKDVVTFYVNEKDGFNEFFGLHKTQSMQAHIFKHLKYEQLKDFEIQKLNDHDKTLYKNMIVEQYWKCNNIITNKNIFVIINDDQKVIDIVHKRLEETNIPVDLVILRVPDIIFEPTNPLIKPQSVEAYREFVSMISGYFHFI